MKRGPKPKDISDEVFERLTAKSYRGAGMWFCECQCGNSSVVAGADLRRGKVRSCGCLHRDACDVGTRPKLHGRSGTPEYHTFKAMHLRCEDSTRKEYKWYGAKGIRVCDAWSSIDQFVKDMGLRPPNTTIDRIDVLGNYEPGNCRWATKAVQANNTTKSVLITSGDRTMTLTEWANELGMSANCVKSRIKRGMAPEIAVITPRRNYTSW